MVALQVDVRHASNPFGHEVITTLPRCVCRRRTISAILLGTDDSCTRNARWTATLVAKWFRLRILPHRPLSNSTHAAQRHRLIHPQSHLLTFRCRSCIGNIHKILAMPRFCVYFPPQPLSLSLSLPLPPSLSLSLSLSVSEDVEMGKREDQVGSHQK